MIQEGSPRVGGDETAGTRAFVALDLDDASREVVARAAAALRSSAPPGAGATLRWTSPEQMHVTVKFLGSVSSAVLDAMGDAVRTLGLPPGLPEATSPSRLRMRVPTRLASIIAFPSLARARVLVGQLEDETGDLASLAHAFEERARGLGVPPETRTYRPHVTFARLRVPRNIRAWIESCSHPSFVPAELTLAALALYRSDPGPSGASYAPLVRVPLA